MDHICHIPSCRTKVSPETFMCRRHWSMVPLATRNAARHAYQAGQWHYTINEAIAAVVARETPL